MPNHSVVAENLGKRFVLGENTARDRLRQALRHITPNRLTPKIESIWAIRDLSFKIEQGEAIGIIGHNGAGKSTLLKVLSRVTGPTEGRATVRGRLATLLEVGTGFHPELTGRDNIFLSGTILGMSRPEIVRKFDEIVSFAETEKFLDTPVKRYSSGMYVRLAFAVAAFLDPDIMIVDEVLAVGDSAFQRKSLGRLNDASAQQGRTVLFVSHNLQAIRSCCKRVLVLQSGQLVFDGPVQEGIERYLKSVATKVNLRGVSLANRLNRTSGAARFTGAVCYDAKGKVSWNVQTGQTARIQFAFEIVSEVPSLVFGIRLRVASNGETITTIRKTVSHSSLKAGFKGTVEFTLTDLPLRPNEISLYSWLGPVDGKMSFDVIDENVDLPYLTIFANTNDVIEQDGLVNLPHRLDVVELALNPQAAFG